MSLRFLLVLSLLVPSIASAEEPSVIMYGASWCGPCSAVKSFLQQNRIAFTYFDIDTEHGRAQYDRARGDFRGIPLTVIGGQQVRGANLESITSALARANLAKAPIAPSTNGPTYGGHAPEWWQQQFRELRARMDRMDQDIAAGEKVAFDHHEKELLAKLKVNREIVSQSIDQLEVDASNVSLPRSYRQ